jgi:hypothetical protein
VSNPACKAFKAATGDYLTVTLEASEDAVSGVATMKDIVLGDLDAKQVNCKSETTFNILVSGTEGISSVQVNDGEGPVYNVAGQRVRKTAKGLYIQDGKKIVVRK